jgi:hypothetical protein
VVRTIVAKRIRYCMGSSWQERLNSYRKTLLNPLCPEKVKFAGFLSAFLLIDATLVITQQFQVLKDGSRP